MRKRIFSGQMKAKKTTKMVEEQTEDEEEDKNGGDDHLETLNLLN